MSMNKSKYLQEKILNMVKGTPYEMPTVYCGIVDDNAVDTDMEAGTLTDEIDGYDDNRKEITFGDLAYDSLESYMSNSVAIDFEGMPAVTIKYAIVCDSATKGAGNILYWCPFTVEKTTAVGNIFRLAVGNLTLGEG